jgi:hypothetical protein
VVQVPGRPRALPVRAAAHLVGVPRSGRDALRPSYLDAEREPRFEPALRADPREPLLRPELPELVFEERLLADAPLRDDDREPPLLFDDGDRPPVLDALLLGSFLRLTLAMSWSCVSLIDSTMYREAPLRLDLERSPRLADNAAPAAFCCFPDVALGIVSPRSFQMRNARGLRTVLDAAT